MNQTDPLQPPTRDVTTGTSTPLIVVRHGESEWNVLGKWQGRADTRLTVAGRAQAVEAADRLMTLGIRVDQVVASSLSRARETGEIIAGRLGIAAPLIDERLVETDVGPWEGLREHEIEEKYPNFLRDRRTPANFELPDAVFARAAEALREWSGVQAHVLIVSHSGVLRTIRRVLKVHDRRLHNLEGCYFSFDETGRLVAGDFVSLALNARTTTNDSV